MLDSGLNIRRITPQVEEVPGITPADLERSMRHLRLKAEVCDLER